ncbi:MAG: 50S ribosomal protein L9 [Bacilli bacterium]
MKVIFIKNVRNQGKEGEIKEVSDGYAQNYLIKTKLAIKASKENVDSLKRKKELQIMTEKKMITKMKAIKTKLEKEVIELKVKVGDKDKLFGSVSSKQIHDELLKRNYKIDRNKIITEHPIITLGNHYVKIELHKEVIAEIIIKVIKG